MSDIKETAMDILEAAIDEKIAKASRVSESLHSAQVSRVDNDGSIWVRLVGAEEDTPVLEATATYKPGDMVSVRIANGTARIVGNFTQPAIGKEVMMDIYEEEIEPTVTKKIGEGTANSEIAKKAAKEAQAVAEAVNQHFWARDTQPAGGAGTGAFVTDETQEYFLAHTEGGEQPEEGRPLHNLLMNAQGILLRAAKKIRAAFTPSGVAFYDGEWDGTGDGASHLLAMFGARGATIGNDSSSHVDIDTTGVSIYNHSGDRAFYANNYGDLFLGEHVGLYDDGMMRFESPSSTSYPEFYIQNVDEDPKRSSIGIIRNARERSGQETVKNTIIFWDWGTYGNVDIHGGRSIEFYTYDGGGGQAEINKHGIEYRNIRMYDNQSRRGLYDKLYEKVLISTDGTDIFLNNKKITDIAPNRFFAGPSDTGGINADAAFRTITNNDLPVVSIERGGTGKTTADSSARALGMAKTKGDTINMSGYVAVGYLTSSKTKMTLIVATPFRFYGFSGATATATATVRQNNLYLFGSTADTPATLNNLDVTPRANGFFTISYTGSTQSSAINNDPVAVYFNSLSITLT